MSGDERITGQLKTRRKHFIFTATRTYVIDLRPRWLKLWDRLRGRP